ncbi:hypothetical protein ACLOJK_023990 [Asimina triloba]
MERPALRSEFGWTLITISAREIWVLPLPNRRFGDEDVDAEDRDMRWVFPLDLDTSRRRLLMTVLVERGRKIHGWRDLLLSSGIGGLRVGDEVEPWIVMEEEGRISPVRLLLTEEEADGMSLPWLKTLLDCHGPLADRLMLLIRWEPMKEVVDGCCRSSKGCAATWISPSAPYLPSARYYRSGSVAGFGG